MCRSLPPSLTGVAACWILNVLKEGTEYLVGTATAPHEGEVVACTMDTDHGLKVPQRTFIKQTDSHSRHTISLQNPMANWCKQGQMETETAVLTVEAGLWPGGFVAREGTRTNPTSPQM